MPEFKIPTKPPIAGVILGLDENDNAVPLKLSDFGGGGGDNDDIIEKLDELTDIIRDISDTIKTKNINYSYVYSYDSNNNMISETRTDTETNLSQERSFSWDVNGNLISMSEWI